MLKTGIPAPNFTISTTGNKTITLRDLLGKNVVLFFFPKAFTPG